MFVSVGLLALSLFALHGETQIWLGICFLPLFGGLCNVICHVSCEHLCPNEVFLITASSHKDRALERDRPNQTEKRSPGR